MVFVPLFYDLVGIFIIQWKVIRSLWFSIKLWPFWIKIYLYFLPYFYFSLIRWTDMKLFMLMYHIFVVIQSLVSFLFVSLIIANRSQHDSVVWFDWIKMFFLFDPKNNPIRFYHNLALHSLQSKTIDECRWLWRSHET